MIVAVASRKGSPGVTSLSTLIGAYWHQPGQTRLILEADPAGGSLAARWSAAHNLTWDPGLLSVSTTRQAITPDRLASVAQPVAEDLWVAAAPPGSDQVVGGLKRMADTGAAALASAPGIVTIADCGRLSSSSPSLVLARRAAVTVLICRPRLDEVHTMLPAVAELTNAGCSLGLVCLGDRPYEPVEVAQSLGIDLLGVIPIDERAADALDQDGLAAGRALRRSKLAAEVEELTSRLQARCVEAVGPTMPAPLASMPPPIADTTPSGATAAEATAPGANAQPPISPSGSLPDSMSDPPPDSQSGAVVWAPPQQPSAANGTAPDPVGAEQAARLKRRLAAAGLEGPLSPAMIAARANAASRVSKSDRKRIDE